MTEPQPKPWQINVDGQTFSEDDLTLGEAEKIVELTGTSWVKIHPLTSPTHLAAIIAVFRARGGEQTATEAFLAMKTAKLSDALDLVGVKEGGRPLDSNRGTRSRTTSRSSRTPRGVGHPK